MRLFPPGPEPPRHDPEQLIEYRKPWPCVPSFQCRECWRRARFSRNSMRRVRNTRRIAPNRSPKVSVMLRCYGILRVKCQMLYSVEIKRRTEFWRNDRTFSARKHILLVGMPAATSPRPTQNGGASPAAVSRGIPATRKAKGASPLPAPPHQPLAPPGGALRNHRWGVARVAGGHELFSPLPSAPLIQPLCALKPGLEYGLIEPCTRIHSLIYDGAWMGMGKMSRSARSIQLESKPSMGHFANHPSIACFSDREPRLQQ